MLRIGLVGCGTIGARLARTIDRRYRRAARIVALHDIRLTHATRLQAQLRTHPPITSLPTLIRRSQLVIEAASVAAAPAVISRALRTGRSVLVLSVGSLLLDSTWRRLVGRSGSRLYVPSGALGGIDAVKALATGRVRRVTLTSRKPPRALAFAPHAAHRGRRLTGLTRPTVVFEGSARDVVRALPQNANVAATLMLAAGASRRTRVRIVADPTVRRNSHEVQVEGSVGRMSCRVESRPSRNPRTSELAVRSALATLDRMFNPLVIGT